LPSTCPEYRVRLYLSVDLSGSTAYKSSNTEIDPSSSPKPTWVQEFERFYQDFPAQFASAYRHARAGQNEDGGVGAPLVWKTIGDEIIFCTRAIDLAHLSACLTAFRKALNEYGSFLEGAGKALDVKGYGWVAAFPSPNLTVARLSDSDIGDEETELRVDKEPDRFDFLGKDIDAGFRTSRFCSADKLSLSLELAYLLAEAARLNILTGMAFFYEGRHILKGVINGEPYPVFFVDIERSVEKRDIAAAERRLMDKYKSFNPADMKDFIVRFAAKEKIELPVVSGINGEAVLGDLPTSYSEYRRIWTGITEELAKREEAEIQAAAIVDTGDGEAIPPSVSDALSAAVHDATK